MTSGDSLPPLTLARGEDLGSDVTQPGDLPWGQGWRGQLHSPWVWAGGVVAVGGLLLWQMPIPSRAQPGAPLSFEEQFHRGEATLRDSFLGLYTFQERQGLPVAEPGTFPSAAGEGAAAAAAEAPADPVAPSPQAIDDALEMRVAIARRLDRLTLGTSNQGWLVDATTHQRCEVVPQTSLTVTLTPAGIAAGDCEFSGALWVEAVHGGYTYLNGNWYRGRVLILNQGDQLLAVNFVLLGHYLASVVGSEMYPDWPLEALKAQAVAARSYALTHHVRPASEHFDLDNTQRFQAYKGVAVEANTTQAAVAATAGEFISYQGGIVESLYAASDQIVQEAHRGQGMSQTGARDRARQGYDYTQILQTYYPGTNLSRLVVQ